MIGKANRFHGYGSLRRVYQQGQTVRGSAISLRYCPNSRRQSYRLAVVVSKKVDKSAVARNRIRRRLYEAFRTSDLAVGPYDLVLTVHQANLKDLPADQLGQQLTKLLQQAGVVSDTPTKGRAMIEPKET